MRSDRQRRREIKEYYLGISADEITSYLTPATFDLWESVARYRRELGIGARWLEIGGGVGDLAAAALDHGYDVLMTDVQTELLETAAARHPRLGGRLLRSDIFDANDVAALAARGPFSIVAALGAVLNHARNHRELAAGFGQLVALAAPGSLLIVDVMLTEMFAGYPASIWADILHVLPGFDDLARLTRPWELQVLEAHSLYHRYPPTPRFDAEFDERMLRLFLYRAQSARPGPAGPPVTASRRARPGARRRAPSPSRDSSGARRATRRRPRA
jgi:2-polyprenyl-3-methyl-5-hydroxy-6-metoxy-1,4-benzoquinol methylase